MISVGSLTSTDNLLERVRHHVQIVKTSLTYHNVHTAIFNWPLLAEAARRWPLCGEHKVDLWGEHHTRAPPVCRPNKSATSPTTFQLDYLSENLRFKSQTWVITAESDIHSREPVSTPSQRWLLILKAITLWCMAGCKSQISQTSKKRPDARPKQIRVGLRAGWLWLAGWLAGWQAGRLANKIRATNYQQ